jgi:hypothetical protein
MTGSPIPDDDRLAFLSDEYEDVEDDLHRIPADADEADVIEQHQELPPEDEADDSGS